MARHNDRIASGVTAKKRKENIITGAFEKRM